MILVCFGTRPEYIKIKPLLEEMRGQIPYETLFTGQHIDLLKDVAFDHKLRIYDKGNRLDSIFSSVLNKIDFSKYSGVMVQGDTASACAMAISAYNQGCKVIHLEAGMRTYDKLEPFPEETYRQCISRMADIHFTPSEIETKHLLEEKVSGKVHEVGNTVLDNLRDIPVSYNNTVIVTMHRRENHHNMREWFLMIENLAERNPELEFVIPLHPNPNVRKHKNIFKKVKVVKPFDYEEMVRRISTCKFLISDSGGIQEEASFLGKMVLVCRKNTERLALIDKNLILCETPEKLSVSFNKLLRNGYKFTEKSPYDKGNTCKLVTEHLKEDLNYDLE